MQRNIFIIIIALAGLLSQSCSDKLELTPEVAATRYSFWKTEKDLAAATRYAMALTKENIGIVQFSHCAKRGVVNDNPISYGEYYRDYRWTIESINIARKGDAAFPSWGNYYGLIAAINHVVEHIDLPVLSDESRREFWLGQALFMRSFTYFHLVRNFGDVVLIKNIKDSGAKARTPWREVLEYALEDARKARTLLKPFTTLVDEDNDAIKDKQYAGRGSVNALIAHICAYRAGVGNTVDDKVYLDEAIEACTRVIKGDTEMGDDGSSFSFYSTEDVCKKVMLGHSDEAVWEINGDTHDQYYTNNDFTVFRHAAIYPFFENKFDINNWNAPAIVIKKTTVSEMYKNGDERRNAYFYKFDEDLNPNNEYAFPYKWRDAEFLQIYDYPQLQRFLGNQIVFRLSGIYLLRAECYSKVPGKEGLAIDDLNRIRGNANADLYNTSEYNGDLTYAIFKEREKELLWEGHRFFDIQRNHLWRTELTGSAREFTDQDVIDGALWLPVSTGAFYENDLMRESAFWNKNLK